MAITATLTTGEVSQPQVGVASQYYTMVTAGTYDTGGFLPVVTAEVGTVTDIPASISRNGYVGSWNSATNTFIVRQSAGAVAPLSEVVNGTVLAETFIIQVVAVPVPPIS